MTTEQIINTLREFNAWRRGGEGEQPDPTEVGKAIDAACELLETIQRERDELLDRLTGLELRMPEELARLERERNEALAQVKRIQDQLHAAMWIIEKQASKEKL